MGKLEVGSRKTGVRIRNTGDNGIMEYWNTGGDSWLTAVIKY